MSAIPPAPQPPSGFWPPLARIEQSVNSLAIGWFLYAGLVAITGIVGLTIAHAFLSEHALNSWHSFGHRFFFGPMMPLFWMKFAWAALLIRFALALAAGYGLYHKTTWGRTLAIVAGCLALLHPVLGTGLGIWTLVILLKAPIAAGYEAMSR